MPVVSRIHLHPIKGFDPIAVERAQVLASGALAFDRRWAFVDARDRFVNGKNQPRIHALRVTFDLARLEAGFDGRTYSLQPDAAALFAAAVSDALGEPVTLVENAVAGFPDDTDSPGPTCVSQASVDAVAGWFGRERAETRRRFRANIEWSEAEAFWEDRLYGRTFAIGDVHVHAVNPCQRCVVPTRDPDTGEAIHAFQRRFAERREAALPAWANAAPFTHFYRFAVNTRIAASEAGKTIGVGDRVSESTSTTDTDQRTSGYLISNT